MARDEKVRDQQSEASLLDRRSYLKNAGLVAASTAGLGTAASSASAAEFRTVTVPSGGTKRFSLGPGDTLENVLIDITATGAEYRINCSGDGWAVRNVGIKGRIDSKQKTSHWTMEGNGVVENVYLGDGAAGGGSHDGGATGLFVMPSHGGDILIKNVNVQEWPDNGIYASAPGNSSHHPTPGAGGTVRIEDSYACNNGFTDFRIGTSGSYVKNSVAYSPNGSTMGCMGYYEHTKYINVDVTHPGTTFRAGATAWEKGQRAQITVENCRDARGSTGGPGTVNGSVDNAPRTDPPEGVPLSAQEAASGTSSSSGSGGSTGGSTGDSTGDSNGGSEETTASSDLSNTLSISGGSASNVLSYRFSVTDAIQKSTAAGATIDSEDSIQNGVVEGAIAGGTDSYEFSGEVSDFSIDGKASVSLNGKEVDLSLLGSDGSDTTGGSGSSDGTDTTTTDSSGGSDEPLPNYVVVDGSGSPRRATTYSFEVDGEVEKDAEKGSVNAYDDVSGGTVTGRIIGGKDAYRFSGDITQFKLDGAAHVTVRDNDDGSA